MEAHFRLETVMELILSGILRIQQVQRAIYEAPRKEQLSKFLLFIYRGKF